MKKRSKKTTFYPTYPILLTKSRFMSGSRVWVLLNMDMVRALFATSVAPLFNQSIPSVGGNLCLKNQNIQESYTNPENLIIVTNPLTVPAASSPT